MASPMLKWNGTFSSLRSLQLMLALLVSRLPVQNTIAANITVAAFNATTPIATTTIATTTMLDPSCIGFEEEWHSCGTLPKCVSCVPQNCSFSAWSDWSYMGGCIALCERHRAIDSENNECGFPCKGLEKETMRCPQAHCTPTVRNCTFSDWSVWSDACVDVTQQMRRTRTILTWPRGPQSAPCAGAMEQTQPCGNRSLPVDCQVTAWSSWSACSVSCSTGYKSRSRAVYMEAEYGGVCPSMPLSTVEPCTLPDCVPDQDCAMGNWTEWTLYNHPKGSIQRFRTRSVLGDAVSNGKRCTGALFEIKPPAKLFPAQCSFQDWQPWTGCTKTCGVGQKRRTRNMNTFTGIGPCPLSVGEEIAACNTQMCGISCAYSTWSPWSNCTAGCGIGSQTRQRLVTTVGKDCRNGLLKEAKPCVVNTTACSATMNRDCLWSQWQDWTTCSLTCGTGTQTRIRTILVPPGKDGKPCAPMNTTELRPCSTVKCHQCIDGIWQAWSAWSACSQTCDSGFQSRNRTVAVQANFCGRPAMGLDKEFQLCKALSCVPNRDCQLGTWTFWSPCSPSCFGLNTRTRVATQQASGLGKPCNDTLKEVRPCNPGVGQLTPPNCFSSSKKDCKLSDWQAWSSCTAKCEGLKQRNRRILQLPAHGGLACFENVLGELQGCNGTVCTPQLCKDCKWGPWGPWSQCGQCRGQQTRVRAIVEMPTYCGNPCTDKTSEETQNCTGVCAKDKFCVWQDWIGDPAVICSGMPCGPQVYKRSRAMALVNVLPLGVKPLAQGDAFTNCSGMQQAVGRCPKKPCFAFCAPQDCLFGAWSDWTLPTCTGECSRQRSMVNASRCGGVQCQGALAEAKKCIRGDCYMPYDCQFSSWGAWTPCGSDPTEQRTKGRSIAVRPVNGGQACVGPLKITAGCWEQLPVDCQFAAWGAFSVCSKSCDGGTQTRKRPIQVPLQFQGAPCVGELEEIQVCNTQQCPPPVQATPCTWAPWSAWTCGIGGQKTRTRVIQQTLPTLSIGACVGPSKESAPCDQVSWTIPAWSSWSLCSKTCGGGQMRRKRQGIVPPLHHSTDSLAVNKLPMHLPLEEAAPCNTAHCNPAQYTNCTMAPWLAWSACSTTCGPGFSKRDRVSFTPRALYGHGCKDPMTEIAACINPTPCTSPVNCVWEHWSNWGACNSPCGGGEKQRARGIAVAPKFGGDPCPNHTKEEVMACNEQSCKLHTCVNGTWDIWEPWTNCELGNKTCVPRIGMVGLQSRIRKYVDPSDCGLPVQGPSQQVQSCALPLCPSVNCSFSAWADWTACPGKCDGVKRRTRQIAQMGSGPEGKPCVGVLREITACPACQLPNLVDCQLTDWFNGTCSVTCGGGRLLRTRHIKVNAKNGGKPCIGPLQETVHCEDQACPVYQVINCKWDDWSDWGICTTCGPLGQRTRSRNIKNMPQHGGAACLRGGSKETEPCPTQCQKTWCTWGDWQAFGACTATCGHALKSRRRYLITSTHQQPLPPSKALLAQKFIELKTKLADAEASRWKDLVAAFSFGAFCFVFVLVGVRACEISRRGGSPTYSRLSLIDESSDELMENTPSRDLMMQGQGFLSQPFPQPFQQCKSRRCLQKHLYDELPIDDVLPVDGMEDSGSDVEWI